MSGVPCKVEVVQMCDMKKEYALTMAKLHLVKEIPAQIADGNDLGEHHIDNVFEDRFWFSDLVCVL